MRCGLESLLSCSWGTQGPEDLAQGFVMKTAGIGERSGFQPRPVPDVGPGPGLASPAGHSCSCPGGDFEQLELQQLGPLEPAAFTLECPHPRPSVPRKSTRASGFLTGWLRPPSQSPGTARVAVVSWPAPAGLQPRRGWGGPCPSHPPPRTERVPLKVTLPAESRAAARGSVGVSGARSGKVRPGKRRPEQQARGQPSGEGTMWGWGGLHTAGEPQPAEEEATYP